MKHLIIYIIGTSWVTLELLTLFPVVPCLDYEEISEDSHGIYHTDEVYYEEPDLSGGVEGVDYMLVYGDDNNNNNNNDEAEE